MIATAPGTQLTWNIASDIAELFRYDFMRNAFIAGTVVAVVAGVVGYFVVLRSLAFAGHALSHIGFAGAAGGVAVVAAFFGGGAAALAVGSIVGLLVFTVGAGVVMGVLGNRIRGRDVVIGIVLAWTLGLGVLFLNLYNGYATEAYAILFGEILGISSVAVVVTLVASVVTLAAVVALYRPLLFASLDDEVAAARGVPVRFLSIAFMVVLAIAVSEAVQVVGVLLIFSLLVTPPAIAERLTVRPPLVIALSVGLAVAFTWLGLAVAYYAPYPVSFFITSIAFATYLVVRGVGAVRERSRLADVARGEGTRVEAA